MVIHKTGKKTLHKYFQFGQYEEVPTPLCVGGTTMYDGKSYQVHRMWKYVTCKHCIRKKK
jgi:hypothetical protein